MNPADYTTQTLKYKIGSVAFEPTYLQAAEIVALIFLLILTLARLRRMYVHWSFKGFVPSIMFGFILALIVEGFLLIGGRTLLTEIIGWDNAPKPLAHALDSGREKLVNVLGAQAGEVPSSYASQSVSADQVLAEYNALSDAEKEKLNLQVCSE